MKYQNNFALVWQCIAKLKWQVPNDNNNGYATYRSRIFLPFLAAKPVLESCYVGNSVILTTAPLGKYQYSGIFLQYGHRKKKQGSLAKDLKRFGIPGSSVEIKSCCRYRKKGYYSFSFHVYPLNLIFIIMTFTCSVPFGVLTRKRRKKTWPNFSQQLILTH